LSGCFPQPARRLYCDEDGEPLKPGTHVRNTDMARTLKRIAEAGANIFYSGEIAMYRTRSGPDSPSSALSATVIGNREGSSGNCRQLFDLSPGSASIRSRVEVPSAAAFEAKGLTLCLIG
jgi:hypothetical protein